MKGYLLTTVLLFFATIALAGPSGPPATPIDGGLGLLLTGGVLYGLKVLKNYKRKN
jgi:hypothetical protein